MATLLSIIGAILVLGFLIIIHELGHYGVARGLGFTVEEFAIGFGPPIFSRIKKNIRYSLRAFPLGGYCKFHGDEQETGASDSKAFNSQPAWKRFLVLVAGAAMNILFAILLAVIILCTFGDYSTQIAQVTPGSSAEVAGVQPGDILLAVNDKQIVLGSSPVDEIKKSKNNQVDLTVQRAEEQLVLTATDIYDEAAGSNVVGVTIGYSDTPRRHFGFFEAIGASFSFLGYFVKEMWGVVIGLFTKPEIRNQVMGPIGTVAEIGVAARSGFESILRMMLLLSVNLGVLNLFPFPGLDGSRLVFLGIEMVCKKPVSRTIEGYVHLAGMLVLMLFMLYITVFDVGRIFGG